MGDDQLTQNQLQVKVFECSTGVYCLIKASDGVTVEKILEQWAQLKPIIMKDWGETDREALIEYFGLVRDKWISNDIQGWIRANRSMEISICLF